MLAPISFKWEVKGSELFAEVIGKVDKADSFIYRNRFGDKYQPDFIATHEGRWSDTACEKEYRQAAKHPYSAHADAIPMIYETCTYLKLMKLHIVFECRWAP